MRRLHLAALALAVALAPAGAHATIISLTSYLDGAQETPPVVTPATGTASLSYDDVTNLLSWTISYSGLVGTTTNAHFHGPAAIGVGPAGVQLGIPFTAGVTANTLIGSGTLTSTQETQLLGGLWYINIHSTYAGGGEIRGQVLVVPEPVAVTLLGAGLLGLAAFGRRHARA